jgi:plasmid stability protein
MADLNVTNISEELMKYLRMSADATGRTVEQVAAKAIENGVKLDKEGHIALADRIRRMTPAKLGDESTAITRSLRDGA